jgi:hypothetical protein
MAEKLIDMWRLATLRVQLDLSEGEAAVVTELQSYPDLGYSDDVRAEAITLWHNRYPLSAFGLTAKRPKKLKVPDALSESVASELRSALQPQAALWLRLVPAYGYLGAAPWEPSLSAKTGIPLLRVPDRLPIPAELGRVWRTVIVVNAAPGSTWAAPYIESFANHLQGKVGAPVQVDVFADAQTATALTGLNLPTWVRVHQPRDAKAAARSRESATRSEVATNAPPSSELWEAWISHGLKGEAARAIHVVLDGAFDLDRPLLALYPDPENPAPRSGSTFVTGDTILALADATGADILSFGSPPGNPADLATRMIADDVGQRRAGATMYSSLKLDKDGSRLAETHAFIGERGLKSWIPRHDSWFAYLQPEYIQRRPEPERRAAWMKVAIASNRSEGLRELKLDPAVVDLMNLEPNFALEELYRDSESVPTWVASSDRYLGNELSSLAQQADSPTPTTHIKGAYNKGAAEALAELRDIVDRNAGPT